MKYLYSLLFALTLILATTTKIPVVIAQSAPNNCNSAVENVYFNSQSRLCYIETSDKNSSQNNLGCFIRLNGTEPGRSCPFLKMIPGFGKTIANKYYLEYDCDGVEYDTLGTKLQIAGLDVNKCSLGTSLQDRSKAQMDWAKGKSWNTLENTTAPPAEVLTYATNPWASPTPLLGFGTGQNSGGSSPPINSQGGNLAQPRPIVNGEEYQKNTQDMTNNCHITSKTPIDTLPFISLDTIKKAFTDYNSPAYQEEPALADSVSSLGTEFGVNPLIMLAFFQKESSMGKDTIAHKAKSVGYVTCDQAKDCKDPCDFDTDSSCPYIPALGHKFRVYASWADSARDWFRLMRESYINTHGLYTIESIMPRYSPFDDNANRSFANTCGQTQNALDVINKYGGVAAENVTNTNNSGNSGNSSYSKITAIGDSILDGIKQQLKDIYNDSISIESAVGRQLVTSTVNGQTLEGGIPLLQRLKDQNSLGDVLIIELGTNGDFTNSQLQTVLSLGSSAKKIIFINNRTFNCLSGDTSKPCPWIASNNDRIGATVGADTSGKVILINWFQATDGKQSFFRDGVHPNTQGQQLLIQLIKDVISTNTSGGGTGKRPIDGFPKNTSVASGWQELRNLFYEVEEKTGVPAGILESIGFIECPIVYDYTSEEVKQYSQPGVEMQGKPRQRCISNTGAKGFTQFMPQTWEGYKNTVVNKGGYTNRTPNIWNIKDNLYASGALLVAGSKHPINNNGNLQSCLADLNAISSRGDLSWQATQTCQAARSYYGSLLQKDVGCRGYAGSKSRCAYSEPLWGYYVSLY